MERAAQATLAGSLSVTQVRLLAWRSRRWIEALAQKSQLIHTRNMEGGCAMAAAHLAVLLFEQGEKFEVCKNYFHCFVRWRHYVVDVTATQFGDYPKVVIRPYRGDDGEDFWIVGSSLDMPGTVNRFNDVMERAKLHGRVRERIGFEIPDGTLVQMVKEFYDGAWLGGAVGRLAEKTLGMSCRALRRRP